MSLAEVSEINSTSPHSFEDAINQGLARAHHTARDVRRAWIKAQEVRVSEGLAPEYQVKMWVVTQAGLTEIAGLNSLDRDRASSMGDEGGVSTPALGKVEE